MEAANVEPTQAFLIELLAAEVEEELHHCQLFQCQTVERCVDVVIVAVCRCVHRTFYRGEEAKLTLHVLQVVINGMIVIPEHGIRLHTVQQHLIDAEKHIGYVESARLRTCTFDIRQLIKLS